MMVITLDPLVFLFLTLGCVTYGGVVPTYTSQYVFVRIRRSANILLATGFAIYVLFSARYRHRLPLTTTANFG